MIVLVIRAMVSKVLLIFTTTPPTAAPPAAAKPAPLPVKLPLTLLSTRASSANVRVALVTSAVALPSTVISEDAPEPLTRQPCYKSYYH